MKMSADMEADIQAAEDRGEPVSLMEPLLIGESSRKRGEVVDLLSSLPPSPPDSAAACRPAWSTALADLVRSMNCYYSNLIEGHDTHPIDIERALKNDYSADPRKRDLQLEAKAHIAVQRWIDDGNFRGRAANGGRPAGNSPALLRTASR